ncbi:NADPH-dependent FMN reductase [Vibrio sonorensis]|uniref:NADPH-dependent FMN reductase n=1 Tax=Vibrio sonorensis TaxID=1004316 RepID=UPI0008D97EE4|nr:NAD(P)H-dependent oxidoreductase [Vibrio sonorensis]
MKLTIISASQRAQSKSLLASQYKACKAKKSGFSEVEVLDLHELQLPLWNEGVWQGAEEWSHWSEIAEKLKASDAFVLVTPEWHGMATPALKNFLLLTTDNEMAHKPALLSSTSAGNNGVYPISELRMTGSKNNHVNYIPDQLIFRHIDSLLTSDLKCGDQEFDARVDYTMQLLFAYATALAPVHRDMLEVGKPFKWGM